MPPSRLRLFGRLTLLQAGGLAISFANQALIGANFGTGRVMDAYWIASAFVLYLDLIITGSLQKVFIPAMVRRRIADPETARLLAGRVIAGVTLGLSALAVTGWALAEPLTAIIAGPAPAETRALAADLLRILIWESALAGLFSLGYGLHVAGESLLRSALINRGMGLVILLSLVLVIPHYRQDPEIAVRWLARAYLLGYAVQTALTLAALRGTPLPFRWRWDFRRPEVTALMRAALPVALAAAMARSMGLVDKWIGSGLGEGAVSFLGYGLRMHQIPQTLLGALSVIFFPVIGSCRDDPERFWETSVRYYRAALMLMIPVALIGWVAADPIVSLIYQRGRFTPEDTAGVADALRAYVGYLVFSYAGAPLGQTVYTLGLFRSVLVLAAAGMAINIVASIGLSGWIGYTGVAWGTSLTYLLSIAMHWTAVIRAVRPASLMALWRGHCWPAAAGLAAWAVGEGVRSAGTRLGLASDGGVAALGLLAAVACSMGLVYGLVLWLARFEELRYVLDRWRRRAIETPPSAPEPEDET